MLRDGYWAGQACYIVGGGPSLRDFDFSLLRDRRTIVINAAIFDVPWADIWISEDERFIRRFANDPVWRSFAGVKVLSLLNDAYRLPVLELDPRVFIIKAREKRYGWSTKLSEGLSQSSNSAIPALNLADILGADPIYVLGIDGKRSKDKRSHYHDRYPSDWAIGDGQLASFRSDFEHWAALHLAHRKVINLNPDSAVTCWPKIDRDAHFRLDVSHAVSFEP